MNKQDRIRCAMIVCAAAAVLLVANAARAATYYVRKTGNNSNSGTSAANAYQTITKAIASAQPGDAVYVGAGTYSESLATARSGTDPSIMRFYADSTGEKTGDAGTVLVAATGSAALVVNGHSFIGFYGFTFAGGSTATVSLSSATNIALVECTVQGGGDGVLINSSILRMTHCTIQDVTGVGINICGASSDLFIQRSTIQNTGSTGVRQNSSSSHLNMACCLVSAAGGAGIDIDSGRAEITNCLVKGSGGTGLSVRTGSSEAVAAWHNTVVSSVAEGVLLAGGTLTLKNNIVASCNVGLKKSGGTLTHGKNLYWSNNTTYSGASAASGDLSANPQFVAAGSDYALQSGSPAINAGSDASSITGSDFDLNARPLGAGFDIGAFEYVAPLTAANTPYSNNFESPMGAEWSVETRSSNTTFTNFAGRHGNNKLTLKLNTRPGVTYTVKFDFYGIDSWDGEEVEAPWGPDRFYVDAGGSCILRTSFCWEWDNPQLYAFPPAQSGNYGYAWWFTDAIYRNVATRFTATSSVTQLDFYAEGLQSLDDESWGIDNLSITGGAKIVKWRDVPVNDNGS